MPCQCEQERPGCWWCPHDGNWLIPFLDFEEISINENQILQIEKLPFDRIFQNLLMTELIVHDTIFWCSSCQLNTCEILSSDMNVTRQKNNLNEWICLASG